MIGSEFGRTPFGLATVQHAARTLPEPLFGYEDDEQQPHELEFEHKLEFEFDRMWFSLPWERRHRVIVAVFGPDFPMCEVLRILDTPTMSELAYFGPKLRAALEEAA